MAIDNCKLVIKFELILGHLSSMDLSLGGQSNGFDAKTLIRDVKIYRK